ncbi:MBL fold metallo-hydrolase [Leptospira langatensis]|uniref:MBL fold metallo-hydrolase n=1 Tax=Leptospira langatensis TaxID=2484983 RepID=A0A5R2ASP4_9LEPT|nr:MBL fold metallo-hydrolase [Leptospira langatensis]TGJ99828.1 MBL fold metallo-hydrolase [Leptospira langatensis]
MKVIALGVNSAFAVGEFDSEGKYSPKFQSNFLLEFESRGKGCVDGKPVFRFCLDFGGDIRHSLKGVGLSMSDVDAWYCSHPHADHIGGLEGIALSTFFHPFWNAEKAEWSKASKIPIIERLMAGEELPEECKPIMMGHPAVLRAIWHAGKPGLNTLQGITKVNLGIYFRLVPMHAGVPHTFQDGNREWTVYTIESTHVKAGMESMPSYGLMFESSDGKCVYFPTDTLFMNPKTMAAFYRKANVIYQDTETGPRSEVHSHIDDIRLADPEIKKKCYLYHYNAPPEVEEGEFAGVLQRGEVHLY